MTLKEFNHSLQGFNCYAVYDPSKALTDVIEDQTGKCLGSVKDDTSNKFCIYDHVPDQLILLIAGYSLTPIAKREH